VLKPAEFTPITAIVFAELCQSVGLPAGVVNIVTGKRDALAPVLAAHDDVDAIWYFGSAKGAAEVEKLSASNMKRTWTSHEPRGWFEPATGEGPEFLREATQVKNVWTPSGE